MSMSRRITSGGAPDRDQGFRATVSGFFRGDFRKSPNLTGCMHARFGVA